VTMHFASLSMMEPDNLLTMWSRILGRCIQWRWTGRCVVAMVKMWTCGFEWVLLDILGRLALVDRCDTPAYCFCSSYDLRSPVGSKILSLHLASVSLSTFTCCGSQTRETNSAKCLLSIRITLVFDDHFNVRPEVDLISALGRTRHDNTCPLEFRQNVT
jgi:hypothetical protein